jgi:hypothetical protein
MNPLYLAQEAFLYFLPDAKITSHRDPVTGDFELRVQVSYRSVVTSDPPRFGEVSRDRERLIQKDYD